MVSLTLQKVLVYLKSKAPFVVYNASAGSGKTFVLVKSFLIKILSSQQKDYYKHILAITFTNKAVAEMKQRVITTLIHFSFEETPKASENMLNLIGLETGLSKSEIITRSQRIVKYLLNHYSLFSVETIDHFNLRLLRTFARDLKLPPNFEVSLESPQLILKAIDRLIDKAGQDEEITRLLIDFALQKTDEDKSWDIGIDLNKAAKLLTIENDLPFLENLKTKSILDFKNLQKQLFEKIKKSELRAASEAQAILDIFNQNALQRSHFSGGHSYDFFIKIAEGNFNVNFGLGWQKNLGIKPLYKAKEDSFITEKMDAISPQIIAGFNKIEENISQTLLSQNILKNIVPLATVNLINQELQLIKEEEAVLPISEFNRIISKEIKNEPAPYIYERLGERYRHFFIDEFQDTSLLQWQNLIPLVDNALSQNYTQENTGSLLLVGDAKQSIYRWRGGLPEQFIDLCHTENPFPSVEKETRNLQTNYRSCKQIIDFNNRFFSFIAPFFGDNTYQKIYEEGNEQLTNNDCEGFVSVNFIEPSLKEEAYEEYVQKVYETVLDLESRGCPKKDICILTRKKEEGVAVSEFLVENNISVVSEETLLLQNSETVKTLVNLLQLSLYPEQEDIKIQVLEFLYIHLEIDEEKHVFFSNHIGFQLSKLEETLKNNDLGIRFEDLASLSLYESFEYIIHSLQLHEIADAYVLHFMDWVFQYSQNSQIGKQEFLSYWETEKEKISLSMGVSQEDAIQVMTIHKSKGLEFPVVIFPFADLDIYREIEAKAWYPWQDDGFDNLLINFSKEVENYGEIGAYLTQIRRNTLELDNINLLYVAFTRAEKELYVLAKNESIQNSPKKYNQFLKLFLEDESLWQENKDNYPFGQKYIWPSSKKIDEINYYTTPYFVSLPHEKLLKISSLGKFALDKNVQASISFGNLIHAAMAKIFWEEDLAFVVEELKHSFTDASEIQLLENTLQNIVTHPKLNALFSKGDIIYNERDIISPFGVIRPDRINIHSNNSVTLLDYKTGAQNISHADQINAYANVLSEMGFTIKEKLIVYIEKESILINNI
jgi:ATP-dependent exoDNAse (exonuclease V) beta subunit